VARSDLLGRAGVAIELVALDADLRLAVAILGRDVPVLDAAQSRHDDGMLRQRPWCLHVELQLFADSEWKSGKGRRSLAVLEPNPNELRAADQNG
jgi:hypothetical protein